MKGWRRLGAVLSVLWFVGFGGWLWIGSTNNISESYGQQLHSCYQLSDMKREPLRYADPQYDQKNAKIESEQKVCEQRASASWDSQVNDLYSNGWWVLLLIDLASVALTWLVACIVVCVGRWVAAGFGARQTA
jgi:hypothetical protein